MYPSIGFCLTLPLKKEILIQCGEHITPEAYADLLIGKTWDPDMLKINYGDLAQDLYDSIAEDGYMNRKMEHIFLFDGVGGKIKFGYREFSFLVTKGMVLNVPFIKGQTSSNVLRVKKLYLKLFSYMVLQQHEFMSYIIRNH